MMPPPQWHDVKIVRRKKIERAVVSPVPPEEFGVSRYARDIRNCGYCFHDVIRREHELIEQGFDADQIKNLTAYTGLTNQETMSRDTVDERQGGYGDSGLNTANREIKVTEHYIVMDYEGDGKPCMYRVTTGGEPTVILKRDGKEDIVKWDRTPPFAVATPILMPHRFFGRSIADLTMDIQRIKTALIRGGLNNLYMQTNPRVEVAESHASVNTVDDLLVVRPNGMVRTKAPGGLNWQKVPDATASLFPALQYFDAQREWRTGVSRQGQGVDPNALQNQVATIANQMQDASQVKVKLIARILAETGIKDLFSLLHATIRRHGSQQQTVRLRNKWVTVDPRDFKARSDMTINVGLGTGSKQMQLANLQLLAQWQEKAVNIGLVSKRNFYNSASELVRLVKSGGDTSAFFLDPANPPDQTDPAGAPIEAPKDPRHQDAQTKLLAVQAKGQADMAAIQSRAALEDKQAQADIAVTQAKAQSEAMLENQRATFQRDLDLLRHQLDVSKAEHKAQLDAFKTQMSVWMKMGQQKGKDERGSTVS